jgi:putative DNA primase/helicase
MTAVPQNINTAAQAVLREAELIVDTIQWDSGLQRCGTQDKHHGKDGAYIAHGDAPASVWWQNWRTGQSGTWTAKGEAKLTSAERDELKTRNEAARRAREEEQARRHKEAAEKAKRIYSAAVDCSVHPYLERKGVKPVPGLKVSTDPNYESLIVPVSTEHGELAGLQFIQPERPEDGRDKNFLTGTAKTGNFFSIGGKEADKPLLICEGLATGLSLHECLELPVLVAFDAGNLKPVAEMARRKYQDRQIIVCADYDDPSDQCPQAGGVGLAKAAEAARAVDGFLAVPRHEGRKVDWNDLHHKMGAGEVRVQFMTHRKPEASAALADTSKEKLPAGFSLRTGGNLPGLWHAEPKESSEPTETWIGPPLHVLGATRDEHGNA